MNYTDSVGAVVDFFEKLSLARVAQIGEVYAEGAHFRDPFNEVQGLPAIRRIFEHLFAQVEAPAFTVVERLVDGERAFLVWDFSFGMPGRTQTRECIRGASHIVFDAAGKVASHRDYWDAAELYALLPVVGSLTRWLRRRISTPQ